MTDNKRPTWTCGPVVWKEDECLRHDPDAERIGNAWQRLFGESAPDSDDCLEEWDGGDMLAYRYPNGRVAWSCYDGAMITLEPEEPQRNMTDDEVFSTICADFPFDTATLRALHRRLADLQGKAQNRPPYGEADGTIGYEAWGRLCQLSAAMGELVRAMRIVETDGQPDDDDIPF